MLTGSFDNPAIIATTALESTPPDKNAPSGTSEIMRTFTASRSRAITSASASFSLMGPMGLNIRSQYSFDAGNFLPRCNVSVWPGGSLKACLYMVRGSGT